MQTETKCLHLNMLLEHNTMTTRVLYFLNLMPSALVRYYSLLMYTSIPIQPAAQVVFKDKPMCNFPVYLFSHDHKTSPVEAFPGALEKRHRSK